MAQKFVLIPEVMYERCLTEHASDIRSDILNANVSNSRRVATLSAAARTPVQEQEEVEEVETIPSNDKYTRVRENISNKLLHLKEASKSKSSIILEEMINNNRIVINPDSENIYLDEEDLGVSASTFLHDLQKYNKKIPANYKRIISVLNLPPNAIVNKFAKAINIPNEEATQDEEEWLYTFR